MLGVLLLRRASIVGSDTSLQHWSYSLLEWGWEEGCWARVWLVCQREGEGGRFKIGNLGLLELYVLVEAYRRRLEIRIEYRRGESGQFRAGWMVLGWGR